MRNLFSLFSVLFCLVGGISANDGVFYSNGGMLFPLTETDISVSREVLTIRVGADDHAYVDVSYEFQNACDSAKTVVMAFEAEAPYNVEEHFSKAGVHPYISDFSVEMNGKSLPYRNAVVAIDYGKDGDGHNMKPINLKEWKTYGEVPDSILPNGSTIYNPRLDSIVSYGYGYFFDATFLPGKNTVHHTYRYHMSKNVVNRFCIPYWLTPAMRWANRRIDDFTLRIRADIGEGVCLEDSLFMDHPFTSADGAGQIYSFERNNGYYSKHYTLAFPNGSDIEWHGKNFVPSKDIEITSEDEVLYPSYGIPEDLVVVDAAGVEAGCYVGETADSFLVLAQDYGLVPKSGHRKVEYKAEKGQGWLVVSGDNVADVYASTRAGSKVIARLKTLWGDIPEAYPCLGFFPVKGSDGLYTQWFKLRVGKKVGYVKAEAMTWSAINTY